MYQGYDPSLLPKNQSIWEIQNNFELNEDEFESLESLQVRHLLAEQPNPTPHVFCSENLTSKLNLDQQIKRTLFEEQQFQNTILQHTH